MKKKSDSWLLSIYQNVLTRSNTRDCSEKKNLCLALFMENYINTYKLYLCIYYIRKLYMNICVKLHVFVFTCTKMYFNMFWENTVFLNSSLERLGKGTKKHLKIICFNWTNTKWLIYYYPKFKKNISKMKSF